jgi:beta-aspartyl-peptidase (threonine type)
MKRGSSLDGVEAAVEYLEGCGAFNAGKGACLTAAGTVELDAAIMTGDGRLGAGVGCVTCTYQAVSLARWVAENTKHVLLVGDECEIYAKKARVRLWKATPSASSMERYKVLSRDVEGRRKIRLWRRFQEGNTVGAAALDADGIPASAVSTGGKWLKLPGRVGDSAIIGAGLYADSRSGAASATGEGEDIIRNVLCYKACEYLKNGKAQDAADRAIAFVTKESGSGTAGIVTVDLKGRVGASFNTEAMGRAWNDGQKGRPIVRC